MASPSPPAAAAFATPPAAWRPLPPAVPMRRLATVAAIVFLAASALPIALLPLAFEDDCEVGPDGDCWAAGMAIVFLGAMLPFALYGFAIGTVVLARLSAGRILAMPVGAWAILRVGTWLVGVPLAGGLLALLGMLAAEAVPGLAMLLAPLALIVMVGPYAAFAGWWMTVILLSRLAFTRAAPQAA